MRGWGSEAQHPPLSCRNCPPPTLYSYQEGQDAYLTAQPGWSQTGGSSPKAASLTPPKSVPLCA